MATLVHELTDDSVSVTLVNLDQGKPHEIAVQAGGYAEHQFTQLEFRARTRALDASAVTVRLAPGVGPRLTFRLKRYTNRPDLSFPGNRR